MIHRKYVGVPCSGHFLLFTRLYFCGGRESADVALSETPLPLLLSAELGHRDAKTTSDGDQFIVGHDD